MRYTDGEVEVWGRDDGTVCFSGPEAQDFAVSDDPELMQKVVEVIRAELASRMPPMHNLHGVQRGDRLTVAVTGGSFPGPGVYTRDVVEVDHDTIALDGGFLSPWHFHRDSGRSFVGWGQIVGWTPAESSG